MESLTQKIEKLPEMDPVDIITYGDIPYDIYVDTEIETDESINQEYPAGFSVTPNTYGGESLSIFLWEGIPKQFKDVVLYHELKEAELRFTEGLSSKEAHQMTVPLHRAYAEKFLSENDLGDFLEWESQYHKVWEAKE